MRFLMISGGIVGPVVATWSLLSCVSSANPLLAIDPISSLLNWLSRQPSAISGLDSLRSFGRAVEIRDLLSLGKLLTCSWTPQMTWVIKK